MANMSFLRVEGTQQGLISSGCNTQDSIGNKHQITHINEISITAISHLLLQGEGSATNRAHTPIALTKLIDKSSPLLAQAWARGELLDCTLKLYRTSAQGLNEAYYEIKLTGARISSINLDIPNVQNDAGGEPQEVISFSYRDIDWRHLTAGTMGCDRWEQGV